MAAYLPGGAQIVLAMAVVVIVAFGAGFGLARCLPLRPARVLSWSLLASGIVGVHRLCADEPPGFRMLALIAVALVAMKTIVVVEERDRGLAPLSFRQWLEFGAGWAGMQPRLFVAPRAGALPRAGTLLARGVIRLLIGATFLALARVAWTEGHSRLVASICLLAGLSFVLHFGLCNLLAGFWRAQGVHCDALFRAPLRSQSLAEFWARRWNLAFSEMTSITVYRPLASPLGRGPALLAGFLVSGLLHEMAISLPVREGFGLPLLYFALHGGLVLVERALAQAGHPITGWIGRVWTVLWLVAPLPLLFHRPFLAGVVWPLVGIPAGG